MLIANIGWAIKNLLRSKLYAKFGYCVEAQKSLMYIASATETLI